MNLFIEKENITKKIELKRPLTLKTILKNEKISLTSVILVKNNTICLEDEFISNSDEIKLLSVVSGG